MAVSQRKSRNGWEYKMEKRQTRESDWEPAGWMTLKEMGKINSEFGWGKYRVAK